MRGPASNVILQFRYQTAFQAAYNELLDLYASRSRVTGRITYFNTHIARIKLVVAKL